MGLFAVCLFSQFVFLLASKISRTPHFQREIGSKTGSGDWMIQFSSMPCFNDISIPIAAFLSLATLGEGIFTVHISSKIWTKNIINKIVMKASSFQSLLRTFFHNNDFLHDVINHYCFYIPNRFIFKSSGENFVSSTNVYYLE